MKSPIFIVGANRSGTTLLRLILNAHTRLAIPEELVYFNAKLAGVSVREWRSPSLSRERYREFVRSYLARNREAFAPLSPRELEDQILSSGAIDLRRPYQVALETWSGRRGKKRWGEKTPGNLFYADVILDMFPDAQFIYLVRDPRAGVHSMKNTHIFSDDVAINALNRRKYLEDGLALLQRCVPAQQRLIVRYEDLVSDSSSTVRQICDFLGEAFEPEMLLFYEDAERYMKPRAVADFNRAATMPITDKMVDAWRTGLRPHEIATIEFICRRSMRRFSYPAEAGVPPVRVVPDVLLKSAYWRFRCWRNRRTPQFVLQNYMFQRKRQQFNYVVQKLSRRRALIDEAVHSKQA